MGVHFIRTPLRITPMGHVASDPGLSEFDKMDYDERRQALVAQVESLTADLASREAWIVTLEARIMRAVEWAQAHKLDVIQGTDLRMPWLLLLLGPDGREAKDDESWAEFGESPPVESPP